MATTPSSISLPNISAFLFLIICIFMSNPCPHAAAYSIANASTDYGNIETIIPHSVLQPANVLDIIHLIRSTTTPVSARGHGHSVRGQAMTSGVVVNMTALSNQNRDDEIVIGGNKAVGFYVDVKGGDLWIDVLRKTHKKGYAPVSWTDYLHLTVGGTLSNAGISGQAFLHGPQIVNVLELDVVTGLGVAMTCSLSLYPKLFLGALGGLGQFGIITRARIVVDTAPKMTKWARLIYSNFSAFTNDQEYLISTSNAAASYVEGFLIINASATAALWRASNFSISSSTQSHIDGLLSTNHGILYSIELAKYYYDDQKSIDMEFKRLLGKLKFIPGLDFSIDVSFFDFINRVGDLDTNEMGSNLQHPWLNLMIPKSNISDFNKVLVENLPQLQQNPGVYILYPLNQSKWNYDMSAMTPPGKENVFYTLGLLHSTPNNYTFFDNFNGKILNDSKHAGIQLTHYLPNFKTQTEWIEHFGSKWKYFSERKELFDPNHILSQGQGIFNN